MPGRVRLRVLLLALLACAGSSALAEEPKPPVWVENPEYLAWSRFAPGSWVSFDSRFSEPAQDPAKQATGAREWTSRLVLVGPERLVLLLQVSTVRAHLTGPVKSPPIRREVEHWVRDGDVEQPWNPLVKVVDTRRSEALTIKGRRLDCERRDVNWGVDALQSAPPPPARSLVKESTSIWRSPAIPGGLVQSDRTQVFLFSDRVERVATQQVRLSGWEGK